jgi:hypothetical protein
MLAAEYALGDPGQRHSRARAYLYCESSKMLSFLRSRLPETEQGKRCKALATRDAFGSALLASPPEPRITADIEAIEKSMASSGMKCIASEAIRLAKSGRKNPAWYEFFDGPRNVEQLSNRVGYPLCYEVLYRLWSQDAHATSAVRSVVRIGDGKVEVRGLRHPVNLNEVKTTAFTLGKELFGAIRQLLPGQTDLDFAKWYLGYRNEFRRRVNITAGSPDA